MQLTRRKLARLTPKESHDWAKFYAYYIEQGDRPSVSDKKAWKDICDTYPRLKAFDGAFPQ
jgi:hypothetical protein